MKVVKELFKYVLVLMVALFIGSAASGLNTVYASESADTENLIEDTEDKLVELPDDVEDSEGSMMVMVCLGGGLVIIVTIVISVVISTVSSVASVVEDEEE